MSQSNGEILFKKFKVINCFKKNEHSAVYLANHIYLDKKVVLKVLNTKTIPDPAITERFKREAKILAQLQHPNIINVYDFGMYKDFFYISFEHFESKNLREILAEEKLRAETKKNIFVQILMGLNFAHNENVVHRDIKPENILVNEIFHVKITDFGLAQDSIANLVTEQYSIIGTPAYMSPEQIQGESINYKSDLFSLGITGYELFSGKNPFLGKDYNETISNIMAFDEKENDEFFSEFSENVKKALIGLLAADPKNRVNSCSEILEMFNIEFEESSKQIHPNKKIFWWAAIFFAAFMSLYLIYQYVFNNELKNDNLTENSTDSVVTERDKLLENDPTITNFESKNDSSERNNLSVKLSEDKLSSQKENSINSKDIIKSKVSTSKFGELKIKCYPWAKVYINEEFIETTPLSNNIVKESGNYELSLIHPDYPIFTDSIEINENQLTFVEVNLDTLFGYLYCQVYPWSEVYINGKKKGITPLQHPIPLTEGKHKLILKNPKYEDYAREITIVKRDTLKLRFNLAEVN